MDGKLRRKRCRGNLKPAPFAITPAIVREVLGLVVRPAPKVIDVPIVAIKLVDRPRRSEDPRLSRANDSDAPVVAPPQRVKIDLSAAPSAMEQLAASWKRDD